MTTSLVYRCPDVALTEHTLMAEWPQLHPPARHLRRCLLDTFDGRLAAAGRCLLGDQLDDDEWQLRLLDRKGRVRSEVRVASLPDHPLTAFRNPTLVTRLQRITAPRALLVQSQWDVEVRHWEWRDELEKVIGTLAFEHHSTDRRPLITTLGGRAKRGYDKALERRFTALAKRLDLEPLTPAQVSNIPAFFAPDASASAAQAAHTAQVNCRTAVLDLAQDHVAQAGLARMIGVLRDSMREQEFGITEDIDIEFLHDFRIAMRKARSLLSCCVLDDEWSDKLTDAFAWLSAVSGHARDLDVWHYEASGVKAFDPALFEVIIQHRRSAHRAMVKALESTRYVQFHQELDHALMAVAATEPGDPPAAYLRPLIKQRFEKLVRRCRKHPRKINQRALHSLRKDAKKLRYLLEACAALYPDKQRADALTVLKRVQNEAGLRCDNDARRRLLEKWSTEQKKPAARAAIKAAQRYYAVSDKVVLSQARHRGLKQALAPLKKPRKSRTLKQLFAVRSS